MRDGMNGGEGIEMGLIKFYLLQDLLSIHYKLADPRKSIEMASRRVGLGVPEWPEAHEARLAREAEEADLREAQRQLRIQVAAASSEFDIQFPMPPMDEENPARAKV
jgi:hypothetical protein